MTTWMQCLFQDSMSPTMEQILFFHDHIMLILTAIMILVLYKLIILIFNPYINTKFSTAHMLEIMWTILPALLLIIIAIPSLRILYTMDEIISPKMTIKTIGHQWYWSYEYSDKYKLSFDSFLKKSPLRLLNTDNSVILPSKTSIRMLITASDVIHAWTIPSLGVKVDAVPGRLNMIHILSNQNTILYGQCSEICGINHSFMPIKTEFIPMKKFIKFMKTI